MNAKKNSTATSKIIKYYLIFIRVMCVQESRARTDTTDYNTTYYNWLQKNTESFWHSEANGVVVLTTFLHFFLFPPPSPLLESQQ